MLALTAEMSSPSSGKKSMGKTLTPYNVRSLRGMSQLRCGRRCCRVGPAALSPARASRSAWHSASSPARVAASNSCAGRRSAATSRLVFLGACPSAGELPQFLPHMLSALAEVHRRAQQFAGRSPFAGPRAPRTAASGSTDTALTPLHERRLRVHHVGQQNVIHALLTSACTCPCATWTGKQGWAIADFFAWPRRSCRRWEANDTSYPSSWK